MSNCSNNQYVSDLIDLVAHGTDDIWNPMTKPINSTFVRHVRASIWLFARIDVKAKWGVEASDDGITWSDGPKVVGTAWVDSDGWSHGPTWFDLQNVTGLNQRNFFRFGLFAQRTRNCSATYVITNLLVWGLLQRYPEARRSDCCTKSLDVSPGLPPDPSIDDFYWNDGQMVPSTSCAATPFSPLLSPIVP